MLLMIQVGDHVAGIGFDGQPYQGVVNEIGETYVLLEPEAYPYHFRRLLLRSTVKPALKQAAPSLQE